MYVYRDGKHPSPRLCRNTATGVRKSLDCTGLHVPRRVGDLFSSGINDMAVELRGKGVPAHALSWTNENAVLSKIEKAYARNRRGPIILVGHSLGAGASVRIARSLTADGIPVDLVIVMPDLNSKFGK